MKSANICTSENEFFLNKVVHLWDKSTQKIREVVAPNSLKTKLNNENSFMNKI